MLAFVLAHVSESVRAAASVGVLPLLGPGMQRPSCSLWISMASGLGLPTVFIDYCCKFCAGQLRLLVCNNDHTVKLFDLPSMRHLQTLTCPVAVNYAALSPDGRHLAAVGDASETYLFRATPSGA